MTEPEKPAEGTPSSYHLPSWIDHAIERSKSDEPPAPADEPEAGGADEEYAEEAATLAGEAGDVSETAETREYPLPSLHTNAPPARTFEDTDTREVLPTFLAKQESPGADPGEAVASIATGSGAGVMDSDEAPLDDDATIAAEAERARQQRAALPWMIAALLLTAAALVLAYLIWVRPTS
jgi:hypothetical protein